MAAFDNLIRQSGVCALAAVTVLDDGGVFKSRTRRAETRDAAEVRDSRITATDLPLDYVRAEQVEVCPCQCQSNVYTAPIVAGRI